MMGDVKSLQLKPIQERAAMIIAEGYTQTAAADACGVTKQTIGAWMRREEFKNRINELRIDIEAQARELLVDSLPAAVKTIARIAKDGGEPGVVNAQLRAAMYIVDFAKLNKHVPKKQQQADSDVEAEASLVDEHEAKELLER